MLIKDIIDEISSHLYGVDLINLSLTCHLHQDLIIKYICKQIDNRLKLVFRDRYDEFKKILTDTNSVISGSFILQCLYNKKWQGDIDIYTPLLSNDKIYPFKNNYRSKYCTTILNTFILQLENTLITDISGDHYQNDNDNYKIKMIYYIDILDHFIVKFKNDIKINRDIFYNTLYHYEENIGFIKEQICVNNCIYNMTKIQTILIDVDKNNISHFINNLFDFDICKNMFYYKNGKPCLYIYNLTDVINKQTQYKFTVNEEQSILRKDKYENRGIKFI